MPAESPVQPATSMRLPIGWYAVFESVQVRPRRPLGTRRFGLDVVAWRDDQGAVVLQEDRCPHRSAKLSLGTVEGGAIACPFHDWRFGADGACRRIPETGAGAPRVRVHTFAAREAHGLIWAWWGPPELAAETPLPWFENLAEGYVQRGFHEVWPTHFTRSVENQLDYAHIPYVHRTTLGRVVKAGAVPEVAATPQRIWWSMRKGESYVEFRLPNVWQNRIAPSFALTLCFVPVDDGHTELILRTHARSTVARLPVAGPLFMWLSTLLNRVILGQDRHVVLTQAPLDAMLATDEILVGSDRAIRWFREQVAAQGWSLTRKTASPNAAAP